MINLLRRSGSRPVFQSLTYNSLTYIKSFRCDVAMISATSFIALVHTPPPGLAVTAVTLCCDTESLAVALATVLVFVAGLWLHFRRSCGVTDQVELSPCLARGNASRRLAGDPTQTLLRSFQQSRGSCDLADSGTCKGDGKGDFGQL